MDCRYVSWKLCLRNGRCSFLGSNGDVCLCELFRGGDFFASRKVSGVCVQLYSKHLRVHPRKGGFHGS